MGFLHIIIIMQRIIQAFYQAFRSAACRIVALQNYSETFQVSSKDGHKEDDLLEESFSTPPSSQVSNLK